MPSKQIHFDVLPPLTLNMSKLKLSSSSPQSTEFNPPIFLSSNFWRYSQLLLPHLSLSSPLFPLSPLSLSLSLCHVHHDSWCYFSSMSQIWPFVLLSMHAFLTFSPDLCSHLPLQTISYNAFKVSFFKGIDDSTLLLYMLYWLLVYSVKTSLLGVTYKSFHGLILAYPLFLISFHSSP